MTNFILQQKHLFGIVLLVWMALQIAGLLVFGIALGVDSPRYIESGSALFSGGELDARAAPYIGYIVIVGLSEWAGFGLAGVVVMQMLIAAISLWIVFSLASSLAGPWAGFWAALPMATFLDFVQWHRYILTDSLSASFTIIGAWLIWRAALARSPLFYSLVLPFLLIGAVIRPNGWLMVLLALLVWSLNHWPRISQKAASGGLSILAFLIIVPLTPSFSVSVDVELPVQQTLEGRVIWGAQETYLKMPPAEVDDPGYSGVVKYALQYPIPTLGLMANRVVWELLKIRTYYSGKHNAYILAYLLPLYLFAAAGLFFLRNQSLSWFLVSGFTLHMALVAITFADWDGRFLLYSLPMLSVLAGPGFVGSVRLLRRSL